MPRKTAGGILDPPKEATASMRPRPDAAENPRADRADLRATHCFNEAAARCRGKLDAREIDHLSDSLQ